MKLFGAIRFSLARSLLFGAGGKESLNHPHVCFPIPFYLGQGKGGKTESAHPPIGFGLQVLWQGKGAEGEFRGTGPGYLYHERE